MFCFKIDGKKKLEYAICQKAGEHEKCPILILDVAVYVQTFASINYKYRSKREHT